MGGEKTGKKKKKKKKTKKKKKKRKKKKKKKKKKKIKKKKKKKKKKNKKKKQRKKKEKKKKKKKRKKKKWRRGVLEHSPVLSLSAIALLQMTSTGSKEDLNRNDYGPMGEIKSSSGSAIDSLRLERRTKGSVVGKIAPGRGAGKRRQRMASLTALSVIGREEGNSSSFHPMKDRRGEVLCDKKG